jgi:hypothetical protein
MPGSQWVLTLILGGVILSASWRYHELRWRQLCGPTPRSIWRTAWSMALQPTPFQQGPRHILKMRKGARNRAKCTLTELYMNNHEQHVWYILLLHSSNICTYHFTHITSCAWLKKHALRAGLTLWYIPAIYPFLHIWYVCFLMSLMVLQCFAFVDLLVEMSA